MTHRMTIDRTITLAKQHAANGNLQGAIAIIDSAARASASKAAISKLRSARAAILDASA